MEKVNINYPLQKIVNLLILKYYHPAMTEKDSYLYLEDLKPGQTFKAGPVTMTQDEIIEFARKYDPQAFHTDPIKAKDSIFGELIASGWHTAALTMRMITEATPKMKGGMVGRSVEKMGWPRVVRPGDTLALTIEVLETWPTKSNPSRGMMRTRNVVRNQKDEIVMEMETVIFVPRRVPA
jgi:acyl dehydratase